MVVLLLIMSEVATLDLSKTLSTSQEALPDPNGS